MQPPKRKTKKPASKRASKPIGSASSAHNTRAITSSSKILLGVRSGGRCEFSGCNRYLFEHPLTLQGGNFSEHAHIVAFSEMGPRGKDGIRPKDINNPDNLMLLCAQCHKLIDDRPMDYPRSVLEAYKRDHENRILHLTGLGPDLRTTVVQLKAKIGGSAVDIPAAHIYEAVAPRYPTDRQGHVIDLTSYGEENRDEYYRLASREICQRVARLYDPGMDVEATRHISLFALAPIPLLLVLGHCLSNKIQVDLYQRHRTGSQPWKWKDDEGEIAQYTVGVKRRGTDNRKVALVASLSGQIDQHRLPLTDEYWIYEIALASNRPSVDFLRSRRDIEEFRTTYRQFLADLMKDHPAIEELHFFPAIPAPVAVACGHDLLPKVHPAIIIYDYDKGSGFIHRLTINLKKHDLRIGLGRPNE
jgi:hypothetical protein